MNTDNENTTVTLSEPINRLVVRLNQAVHDGDLEVIDVTSKALQRLLAVLK